MPGTEWWNCICVHPRTGDEMLEVRGLTKRFRSLTVVDRVSFAVRPGEITGYLGPTAPVNPRRSR